MNSGDAQRTYSLDELAALGHASARTVRYYITQGLVSRPEGAKRGAYYTHKHLEQLLLIRRWSEAGLSLDRIRELLAGAPEDPPPRRTAPGTVEVWSRVTLADGFEIHIEPGRAGLTPEEVRHFVREATSLYRHLRAQGSQAHKPPRPSTAHAAKEPHDDD